MVVIAGISAMKKRTRAMNSKSKKAEAALRTFALKFPGAREEFPWGERVVKVGKKVFVFMGKTVLCAWIDESYRAIAPRTLLKKLRGAAT